MSSEQQTMDQILEKKIHDVISEKFDQSTISKDEVTEIVDELKTEMEEIISKKIKVHFRSLAEYILKTMED